MPDIPQPPRLLTDAEVAESIKDPASIHYLTEDELRSVLYMVSGGATVQVSQQIARVLSWRSAAVAS